VTRLPACSSFRHFAAAQIEVEDERFAGRLERAVDLVGAVAIVSASWLEVLTMASVSSCERPTIMSTIASDFSEKFIGDAVEPRRHHVFETAAISEQIPRRCGRS
jgi:hypothetical protein